MAGVVNREDVRGDQAMGTLKPTIKALVTTVGSEE